MIEGEQGKKKNVREMIASWQSTKIITVLPRSTMSRLAKTFSLELGDSFVNYHELSSEKYRILGAKEPAAAMN